MQLPAKALLKPFSNLLKDDDTTKCGNDDEDAGGGVEPIGEVVMKMTMPLVRVRMRMSQWMTGRMRRIHLRCWMRLTMSSYWKIQWLCM
jgi:hypothetical protein